MQEFSQIWAELLIFSFWATSQPQLLATWLHIKNRVLEHFFRVVLFHDTRSSDLRFMHNCLSLHIMKELMQEETV